MPLFGCIVLGLAGENPLARALGVRPLVFVGEASYCLYLLHFNMWNLIHDTHVLNKLGLSRFDPWISYVLLIRDGCWRCTSSRSPPSANCASGWAPRQLRPLRKRQRSKSFAAASMRLVFAPSRTFISAKPAKSPAIRLGFLISMHCCRYGVTDCTEWLPCGTLTTAVGFGPVG